MSNETADSGSTGSVDAGPDRRVGGTWHVEGNACRDGLSGASGPGPGHTGFLDVSDDGHDPRREGRSRAGRPADPRRCVAALRKANGTVATAESLTGGLVAATLTSVPGSSWVVLGGVVAYCRSAKSTVLGVGAELLDRGGAVQQEVARQMAVGVRTVFGAQWGVATTGVAGPDPSDGQPVGTVFLAVSGPDGDEVVPLTLRGDREAIRAQSVSVCLDRLTERVEAHVVGANRYR